MADAEELLPQRIRVVSNGIPDPSPEFRQAILPRRRARFADRNLLLASRSPPPRMITKPETIRR